MYIANAAGIWCKTIKDVECLSRYPLDAITIGTITVNAREPKSEIIFDGKNSWNALGLPNPGLKYYKDNLQRTRALLLKKRKDLQLSVFGETIAE